MENTKAVPDAWDDTPERDDLLTPILRILQEGTPDADRFRAHSGGRFCDQSTNVYTWLIDQDAQRHTGDSVDLRLYFASDAHVSRWYDTLAAVVRHLHNDVRPLCPDAKQKFHRRVTDRTPAMELPVLAAYHGAWAMVLALQAYLPASPHLAVHLVRGGLFRRRGPAVERLLCLRILPGLTETQLQQALQLSSSSPHASLLAAEARRRC
jgi:hypothetical protein